MALRTAKDPGVWNRARAHEIEIELERMITMMDECDMLRESISSQAWVAHEKLITLQLKICDRRLNYLFALQGIEPERLNVTTLNPAEMRAKVEKYRDVLEKMMEKMPA